MVPTFALYPLPLMQRPAVESGDLPTATDDFAAVLAALEHEVPSRDATVPISSAAGVVLAVPALARRQAAEAQDQGPAPNIGAWPKGASPDEMMDDPTPEVLAADMPGQIGIAPSTLVLPNLPFDAMAASSNPVLHSEPVQPRASATLPDGSATLTAAPHSLPERDAEAAVRTGQTGVIDLGTPSPAKESASRSATASMPVTEITRDAPSAAAAAFPNSGQVVTDDRSSVAPVSANSVAAAIVPATDMVAAKKTLPISPLDTPSPPRSPMLDRDFPNRPMQEASGFADSNSLHGPETALQDDPVRLVSLQSLPQTAAQAQPMTKDAAILTASAGGHSQLAPFGGLHAAQIEQTLPSALRQTAPSADSAPDQTAPPIPATGLRTAAQGIWSINPEIASAQGRTAPDQRETATEYGARSAETLVAPAVTLPGRATEPMPPVANGQTMLDRPPLSDATAETLAILRQLAPTTPDQDGAMEIALFPKGLGQVRLDIQHGPDGARIVVSADRPETLDLIRRHSADLVAEFRAAGIANPVVSFASVDGAQATQPPQRPDSSGLLAGGGFGSSSQHTDGSPQGHPASRQDGPLGAEHADLTPPPHRRDVVPRGGLILRL